MPATFWKSPKRVAMVAAGTALAATAVTVGLQGMGSMSPQQNAGLAAAGQLTSVHQHVSKAPKAKAAPALRVMPLGDSITYGYTPQEEPGGYRDDLWQLFRDDQQEGRRPVQFVGSEQDGPSYLGDKHHEGWRGWRIDELLNGYGDSRPGFLVNRLRTYRPDVILLHIGTNDIIQNYRVGKGASAMAARLSTLISTITRTLPHAKVYVATILPFTSEAREKVAAAYNARIPAIVRAKATNVHLVDMHRAVSVNDIADGVHPTRGGYSKMAKAWYTAVTGERLTRYEAESPANTRHGDAIVIATRNASDGHKIGHLDKPGDALQFNLSTTRPGRYRMYVRAANGTSTISAQWLSVNGGHATTIFYPDYGWDQWSVIATDITLVRGENTIRFSHDFGYAELDSIDLAPR